MLIRVERPLGLDSEGLLVASVLSKKIAAGSTHVLIDIPVGRTAKVRSPQAAATLAARLTGVGVALGLAVETLASDGAQPVGRGIGQGLALATSVLASGAAWTKFQAICAAQGGMRTPPRARFTHVLGAAHSGRIVAIDNGRLAQLAGAPANPC